MPIELRFAHGSAFYFSRWIWPSIWVNRRTQLKVHCRRMHCVCSIRANWPIWNSKCLEAAWRPPQRMTPPSIWSIQMSWITRCTHSERIAWLLGRAVNGSTRRCRPACKRASIGIITKIIWSFSRDLFSIFIRDLIEKSLYPTHRLWYSDDCCSICMELPLIKLWALRVFVS